MRISECSCVCMCRGAFALPHPPHFPSHPSSSWSMRSDRSLPSPSSSRRRLASRLMFRRMRIVMFVHSGSLLLPLWWPVTDVGVGDEEIGGSGSGGLLLVFLRRLRVPANLLSDMGKRLLSNCRVCFPAPFCPGVINITDRNAFRCCLFETFQSRDLGRKQGYPLT